MAIDGLRAALHKQTCSMQKRKRIGIATIVSCQCEPHPARHLISEEDQRFCCSHLGLVMRRLLATAPNQGEHRNRQGQKTDARQTRWPRRHTWKLRSMEYKRTANQMAKDTYMLDQQDTCATRSSSIQIRLAQDYIRSSQLG